MGNTAVGVINIFFGGIALFQGSAYLFLVIPKLMALYEESTIPIPYQPALSYILAAVMIAFGIISLVLGHTQFTLNRQKHFKKALIVMIINLLFIGFYIIQFVLSMILPIYKLTTSF